MARPVCIVYALLIVLLTSCASISGSLPNPEPPVPPRHFQVGAAKVDLTPMPGYPMGGMAAAGQLSRGVWTRLYARAVAFEDAEGNSMAMVSCDLWAMPAGLADRVAELVASDYEAPRLGREQIVIAATHTHHSPGNYSSSPLYNTMASPEPGFDRDLFDFLSHQIAGAIGEAWQNRRPAALVRSEMALGGIARNRSLGAFLQNGEAAQQLLQENSDLRIVPTPFPVGGEKAYRAIDPTLTVIRAEPRDAGGDPLAVLAFYALHPTAMGPATQVYSSDLFGVAATLLENELDNSVVAIFNGAEGDVAANWKRQDRPSTLTLGASLADGIRKLIAQGGKDVTGPIRHGFSHSRLADLAKPVSGASTFAGAEPDWTFFRDAGWREGLTEEDPEHQIEGQGVKKHPLSPELVGTHLHLNLPLILDEVAKVPEEVPIGAYQLGEVTLVTLPGEFTTMLGRRISRSVAEAVRTREKVLLVGLANEYLSYFATEEEYRVQHYEGSSMLYGPLAGAKIEADLISLARELAPTPRRAVPVEYHYWVGPTNSFGVKAFDLLKHSDRFEVSYLSLGNVLMDEATGIPAPYNPFVVWVDENPCWTCGSQSTRATPRVSIEALEDGGWRPLVVLGAPETDEGLDFVTIVVGSFRGKSRWLSIWLVPDGVDEDAALRFVMEGTSGRSFRSPEFSVAQARDSWGFVGLIR
jgi:neutral ceramidase